MVSVRRVLVGAVVAGVVVAAVGGQRLWYGEPYPVADPDRVAERLEGHSQQVFDALPATEGATVARNSLRSGVCYARGLRTLVRPDTPEPDVYRVQHRWQLAGLSEREARQGLARLHGPLTSTGWEQRREKSERYGEHLLLSVRYEKPVSGDALEVAWNGERRVLFVDVYAPCARVPEGHPREGAPAPTWSPDAPR